MNRRTRVLFPFAVLLLLFVAAPLAAQVVSGMDETDLVGLKGRPQTKAVIGDKAIYRWPDMEVIVRNRKVISVKRRDLEAERLAAEARAKRIEEAQAREAALLRATPPASTSGPTVIGMPKTPLEQARENVARAEKIAGLRRSIRSQHQLIDLYSRGFTTPSGPTVTPEQRDVAQALIVQYEAEIEELERQP